MKDVGAKNNTFTRSLALLLLRQSGLISENEFPIDNPGVPAPAGDILRSKNYWNGKFKGEKNEKTRKNPQD